MQSKETSTLFLGQRATVVKENLTTSDVSFDRFSKAGNFLLPKINFLYIHQGHTVMEKITDEKNETKRSSSS